MSGRTIAEALEAGIRKAGPVMSANFTHEAWRMDADAFRQFWGDQRMASVSTVGASGWPHTAPLEVWIDGDEFIVPSFAGSVRLKDVAANARISITAWDDPWHAAIIYGTCTQEDAIGSPIVHLRVRPTRIYAIRAPAQHRASREPNE